jgi:WD40 repeat protein
VVRAGLLPALAGGVLPGSDNWTQALIRPGDEPLRELRRALRRLGRERRGLLAVDQFEELFTACRDEEERADFVDALVRTDATVVIAVRADFYGRCAAYPELSRLVGANHVLVGPMTRDELRRAIERPAERVGLSVEPELVDTLLRDVEDQPGALPLLSTALLELWRSRDGRHLRLAAYARSGGVQGAVARLAEDAYLALDQTAVRRLLLRLCDESPGGAIVRRRVALDRLEPDLAEVADRLADRRLLTISDGAVEVAHEALLREWPRLRGWLDEDAQGRRLHRQLGEAARAWDADARDAGGLYRGARLASALDWAVGHEPELDEIERAFLADSRRASGRAQRRLRLVLAGVVSLLVVAVAAGIVALEQRGNARDEATVGAAQRLGAQALAEDDLDRALLLARQGVALDDSVETRSNLFATLLKSPAAIGLLRSDGWVLGLDLSPDGRRLAFIDLSGRIRVVDTATRRVVVGPAKVDQFSFLGPGRDLLRFSPDGTRLAVGGGWGTVLDAATLRLVAHLAAPVAVDGLAFSPDGRTVLASVPRLPVAFAPARPSAGVGSPASATLQPFDARNGRPLGPPRRVSRRSVSITPIFMRDGTRIVTSDEGGPTVVRDARTLRPLTRFAAGGERAALSPDDRTLLLGGADGTVRFLDLVTGRVRTASGRHVGAVVSATFGTSGRVAATAGEDKRVIVWDVAAAAAGDTLDGHAGQITGVEISPDGGTLYSSGFDSRVVVWDLAGDQRLGRRFSTDSAGDGFTPGTMMLAPGTKFPSYGLDPNGRTLAVGHDDGTVTLTDARSLREIARVPVGPGPIAGIAFVPGSRTLVVSDQDAALLAVDTGPGHRVTPLHNHGGAAFRPSVSADGRRMSTIGSGGKVMVWTLRAGRQAGPPRPYYPGSIEDASLSPDGRTLAVLGISNGIELVDADKLKRRAVLPGSKDARFFVQFSPDGRYILGGGLGGRVRVWSAETGSLVGSVFAGNTEVVLWAAMSPDGRMLAAGSNDGTLGLFDFASRRPLGARLPGLPNRPVAPLFTPDGTRLLAISYGGPGYSWDVRPSSWARQACAVAGRRLTRAEWAEVLPGRDYAPACG